MNLVKCPPMEDHKQLINQYNNISKTKLPYVLCLFLTFNFITLQTFNSFSQGVAINETGNDAVNSAILDVSSTTQGVLISRMTTAQRSLITSPATGLFIYNTDCNNFNYYNGSAWIPLNTIGGSAPATPGSISGSTSVCNGQTGVSYTVSSVSGATSYTWVIPDGASLTSGQGSSGIAVTFGTNSGNICVTASNSCGTSSPTCLPVTNYVAPAAAGTITGTNTVCQGQNNVSYSVPAITNATSYTWAYSGTGATISGSTNPVTINFSVTATLGDLTVQGTNICENGTQSSNYPITVNSLPAAPVATAGTGATQTQITANWSASTGASGYYLDVATDITFTGILTNYNNLNVSSNLTCNITGLSCGKAYYYRLKAYNTCGTSDNSGTITYSTSLCCPNAWSVMAADPVLRSSSSATVVNNIIYVIGGTAGGTISSINEAYDPATNTWTTKAAMPTARYALGVAAVNGIIYAIGGSLVSYGGLATNESYNPVTDQWTTGLEGLPTPRLALYVIAVNNKIYAIGGGINTSAYFSGVTESYDPSTGHWTSGLATKPTSVYGAPLAVYNNTIYAMGGVNTSWVPCVANEAYNISTNSWSSKASLPIPVCGSALATINNIIYAAGGSTNGDAPISNTASYNPSNNTWTTGLASMIYPLISSSFATVNNVLYVTSYTSSGPTSVNEAYCP